MAGVLYGLQAVWPLTSLVRVAVAEAAGTAVFAAAFWWLGLEARERTYLGSRVMQTLRRR
jgi:hypothetical protein